MKFPGAVGLHNAICKSALACEGDIRRDLLSNIVLTGGSSVIPGLQERLLFELGDYTLPAGCKARISAASESERAHGAWLGGSILASLGTFPDLWLSKDEYNSDPRMLYRKLI
jgi:actin-related protein